VSSPVLITGGGTGLGQGIAAALRARGHAVTLLGRREAPLRAAAAALGCRAVVGDVTGDPDLILDAVGPVDHIVHNAGVYLHGPLSAWTAALWRELHEVTVVGPALLSAAWAARQAGPGSLTFVSSTLAARPAPGTGPYAAAKAGQLGLMQALAVELAPRQLRSNAVLPGVVPTPMTEAPRGGDDPQARLAALTALHPLGRLGQPADIGEAVAYLVGARWVTGAALPVDGGLLAG
jgi:NAD(P)-dependent dehydrogenase (short-subunit alcohol dehydrogenase family)